MALLQILCAKTRVQYHAAIRKARKEEANIVNERFANALSDNTQWTIKKRDILFLTITSANLNRFL